MAMKRIGFVLPGLGIFGGINILLNWAQILAKSGYRVDLILPSSSTESEIPFLSEHDGRLLHKISENDAQRNRYHAVMSSNWQSIASLAELSSDHYAWFMQAFEAQFIGTYSPIQVDFDELVAARMNVITTANWLQQHILRHHDFESKQTFCVISGLDKSIWRPVPRMPPGEGGGKVRFLVEGPIQDPRKNVARTIKMLEALAVPYQWVGSSVDRELVGPNCFGIRQQVPYREMPGVYGSVDVLVKASNSEGMFGPPLEMFATGGTAVAWHVQGAEEYMSDRYNSYLVPMNSWSRLREAIQELAGQPERVRRLQENALATTEAWPSWDDQADQIVETIDSLAPFDRLSIVRQVSKNQYRTILHMQPPAPRPDSDLVERAMRAETELAVLKGSRAMRLVSSIQRGRRIAAPDHSRRWRYILGMGRLVRRAARHVRSIRRAA